MMTGQRWCVHLLTDVAGWVQFWQAVQVGHLIPYVDITREYPVAAGWLYAGMAPFLSVYPEPHYPQVFPVHALFMLPADLANVALVYACTRHFNRARAPWLTLLWTLTPTGLILGPVRFESWVILCALGGYWFHLTGRPARAALVWSLGCWFKWYPAFFLAAQEVGKLYRESLDEAGNPSFDRLLRWPAHRQWLTSTAIFLLVAALVNGPLIALSLHRYGHFDAWLSPYQFHANRPLFWDTVLGVATLYLGEIPWERKAATFSAGLMLLMLLARPRLPVESKGALVCMAAVLFNRVYSTQFNLWFDPFLLILCARLPSRGWYRAMLAMYVLVDLVNVFIYPLAFTKCLTELHEQFKPLRASLYGGVWTLLFSLAIGLRTVLLGVWMGMVLYLDPLDGVNP